MGKKNKLTRIRECQDQKVMREVAVLNNLKQLYATQSEKLDVLKNHFATYSNEKNDLNHNFKGEFLQNRSLFFDQISQCIIKEEKNLNRLSMQIEAQMQKYIKASLKSKQIDNLALQRKAQQRSALKKQEQKKNDEMGGRKWGYK